MKSKASGNGARIILGALALALAAGTGWGQSEGPASVNAVGLVRKTLPAGEFVALGVPLDEAATTAAGTRFGELSFAAALPVGSIAYFWDVATQTWAWREKDGLFGWGDLAERRVASGEAFLLKNQTETDVELVMRGMMPSAASLGRGLAGGKVRSLVVNPYPVPRRFGEMDLAGPDCAPLGTAVSFWDAEAQAWMTRVRDVRGGWGTYSNRVVEVGEGFFIQPNAGAGLAWEETRPYTWPCD